jgi:mRNA interferase MazF
VAKAGDIVVVDFPGVQGVKRRPTVVVSSDLYHQTRPDVIVGLITSQLASAINPTDHLLQDWQTAGLTKPSAFQSYFATLPRTSITAIIGRTSDRDRQTIVACVHAAMMT